MSALGNSEYIEFGERFTEIFTKHKSQIENLKADLIKKLSDVILKQKIINPTDVGVFLFRTTELELLGKTITHKITCSIVNFLENKLMRDGLPVPHRSSKKAKDLFANELRLKNRYPFLIEYDQLLDKSEEDVIKLIEKMYGNQDHQNCSFEDPCNQCDICKDVFSLLIIKLSKLKELRTDCFNGYLVSYRLL